VAPRRAEEELLAAIWADLLGLDTVSVNDSFFELGGHSLMAARMVARIRAEFGIDLPLRRIFETPTIAGLAEGLSDAQAFAEAEIPTVSRAGPLALSFGQQRLWFLNQLDETGEVYNLPAALRIRGPLDLAALEAALTVLVRRHEILRTSYTVIDGEPTQTIHAASDMHIESINLTGSDAIDEELASWAARRFGLAVDWPIRCGLARLSGDDHVLAIVVHHIASDGWSTAIFFDELGKLYGANIKGSDADLSPLPLQYADFAAWQRRAFAVETEARARLEKFWQATLAGAPSVLQLPTDRPQPAVQSHRGAAVPLRIDASLGQRLQDLANRHSVTMFMVLHAAFTVLLGRYASTTDVVIGTPIANRPRRELEGLIGFFVGVLPLRLKFDETASIATLLAKVREADLAAFAHQDLPFERLVDLLRVERALDRSPVFQVVLSLENTPRRELGFEGLACEPIPLGTRTAQHDLALLLRDDGVGDLQGLLEYNTDLFDKATVDRLSAGFTCVLEAMVAAPDGRVSDLMLQTAEELSAQDAAWNATSTKLDGLPVPLLISAQAMRTPDAPAVTFGAGVWSYAELEAQSNRIARRLRELGVGSECVVGLCLRRTPWLVAGLLGILKAGGAYLPLDPSTPRERLDYMLSTAGADIVLSEADLFQEGDFDNREVLFVGPALHDVSPAPVSASLLPDQLAYVINTSGSTGRPKGVMVSHGALENFLMAMAKQAPLMAGETVLALARLSFDISILELLYPLIHGAKVALVDEEAARDPDLLQREISRRQPHFMQATPSTFRLLLDAGWSPPPALRLLVGGEALPPDMHKLLTTEGRSLVHLYGPTETTVWSMLARLEEADPVVHIGRPVANMTVHVLDRSMRPTPIGVPGEICIGGLGVARGYAAQPSLTAERFVPDPFGPPGSRLYRTGDLARRRADGTLVFLGRLDFQMKLRGFRIEPGEIEVVLRRHAAVADAVVTIDRTDRLVAHLVAETNEPQPASADLRAHLAGNLPDYMIPARFVWLPAMPLSANGKLDRNALPDSGDLPGEAATIPPRTALEMRLAQIWEGLFERRPIGVRESFFDLGGHSLLAAKLAARIRGELGLQMPLAALFQAPTIERLAARLRQGSSSTRSPLVPIQPRGDRRPLFLVHPAGGSVLCYRELAQALDPAQPVMGLEAPGSEAGEQPFDGIETMAGAYVDAVQRHQPTGPYRIAGWSMGGIVAVEMARQLSTNGEVVEFLGVIDAAPPMPSADSDEQYARRLLAAFADDLGVVRDEQWEDRDVESQLAFLMAEGKRHGVVPESFSREDAERQWRMRLAHDRALAAYRLPSLPLSLVLFAAQDSTAGERKALAASWLAVASGGCEFVDVPGDHLTLVKPPHVEALAASIERMLPRR
jgi:amino acid adenylation domain-containing protein